MLKLRRFFSRAGGLLAIAAGLMIHPACHAADNAWNTDRLVIKGFGTLGLARADSDTAEFVRDLSQPRGLTKDWSSQVDSLVGLQANLKLGEQTEGVVQLISRYRYDGSYRPEVSWAFLRHEFTPDAQVRVGRLGTEFYMLADSRLIGYANTTVRPPPDFYGPLIFSYFDGLDVSGSLDLGQGLLRGKLFAGRSPEQSPFFEPVTWDLSGSRLIGGHLDYFIGPWQFRLARAEVKFSSHELPLNYLAGLYFPGLDIIALAPELSTIRTTSRFDSLGIVYEQGPLRVQTMFGRIRHESAAYEDSRTGFINGSYRIGKFTPYLGYSTARSTRGTISSPLPAPIDMIVQEITAGTHVDQHTTTLGVRWNFHENYALKVQYDALQGARDSKFFFRGPNPAWDGRMRVLSVALDFAF
jgi:hypothetical protein